jgi:hypothetical protein
VSIDCGNQNGHCGFVFLCGISDVDRLDLKPSELRLVDFKVKRIR